MKEYTIARRGKNFDWKKLDSLVIDEPLKPTEADVRGYAQIAYDSENLYVRLWAEEKEIRAEYTGKLDEVCEDSCLEFFFAPIWGDSRYFNLECNLNGAIFLGFGSEPGAKNIVRLIPEVLPIKIRTKTIEGGWEVEHTIPFSFIRHFFPEFAPKSGDSMRANCYKCGDLTEKPHDLAWNPVPVLEMCSFHNPDFFGLMHFE